MNTKELKTGISLRIRKMRQALKYSQEKMGAHLGIKRASYTKYECSRAIPPISSLNTLATHFDVSLDWLVSDKGPMFYKGKVQAEDTGEFMGEVKELFDHMGRIPLLRHEVLSCFHKFKLDYKDLVESSPPRVDP